MTRQQAQATRRGSARWVVREPRFVTEAQVGDGDRSRKFWREVVV